MTDAKGKVMSMKQLPSETIKLISSTQVITSTSSVVKELMENSIDANATIIDIRLDNYGLDKIEIRDNGVGISHSDVYVMCLRNYTSKISEISDLGKLTYYGFRGEALSSICAVADVTVITKSDFDEYAKSFTMDSNGRVKDSTICHHQKGTVIKIVNLFKKLPVRKQIYSSKKHCVNDLRRVENIVKSLAAIQQNVRVSLVHNKSVLWQMTSAIDLTVTFGQIWSSSMTKYVKHLTFTSEEVNIDIVLPVQNIIVQNCFFTTNVADAIYLYVNKRPVRDNKIEKLIVGEFNNYFGHYLPPGKYLPCLISITIPPETIDINLEPDKSRILFHNQDMILLNLKNCITKYYYNDKVENDQSNINEVLVLPNNKRKIPFDSEEFQIKKSPILMSPANDSFIPNAESTKIINNESFNSVSNNDEHTQIVKELSLEDIDFEEPFISKKNKSDNKCLENYNEESTDDISEYRKKLLNVGSTSPFRSIQSDDTNVRNFNTEDISISQWSKGDVVLNGKPLESGVVLKSDLLLETLDKNSMPKMNTETEILHSKTVPHKDENIITKNCNPVHINDESSENISVNSSNSSMKQLKLEQLFRTVSVPDEQIPGLNHLVNRPQSWVPQPRSKRPTRDIPEEDLSDTIRSVSSQMGNKEMSGFTLFAREMRIKIIQENPGIEFTKVSKELARLWGSLSEDEKLRYKKLSDEQKKVIISKTNEVQLPKKSFQSISKNLERHSTQINVELSEIKRNILKKPTMISSEFMLIGQIEDNIWLCCVRNEIQVLNICRLQEAVIFFQKLADSEIPLKMLDQSIITSKKYLGEKNYRFLMDLDTSYEPSADKYTITDKRIIKNGFNVVIVFNDDSENPDINITDVALHISTYGVEELKQLLELMQLEKENNLHCCRPLKVVNYLRSETVRHCKTTGLPKTKEEINNLLEYWFQNEKLFSHNTCIHYKKVFSSIHCINEKSRT